MKVVFMGTPEFAVPSLNSIYMSKHTIVAVVCQPDRAGNRGVITKPPVKVFAEEKGIKVLQFNKVSKEGVQALTELNADIMVTAAFGQILSDQVLGITPYGVINVHASLLPYYRGSAPIHYAIINGETKTGITIMQTAKAVDSGDIILQEAMDILPEETTGELTQRLAELGSQTIVKALDLIESGQAIKIPQDHSKATHYPMLKKEDGRINYNNSAESIVNFVRGMNPWPSAYTIITNNMVKIIKAVKISNNINGLVGEIIKADSKNGLVVQAMDGEVAFSIVQPQGKRAMDARDYLLGRAVIKGQILC